MAKKEEGSTSEELESERQRNLILKCRRLESQAQENRRKFDWEWLVRILYKKGYHFARYNRATSTVVFSTRTGVRIPINLVAAHTRGVRNQVTSFQPKWEVLPNVTTESAFENARYSGKTLDYIYEKAQIKRKIKEAVDDALWSSIGVWFFDTNKKKNVVISRIDPFDLYIDPNVKSPDLNDPEYGAEFVILKQQVPIDAIRKNTEFKNTEEVKPDNFVAAAEYKRFLLQVTTHQVQGQSGENGTKILSQAWIRERDEKGEIKLKLITYVDGVDKPLKEEELDDSEYPFEILQGDISPGSLYGESWLKHLIPINRVIDALESHIFEYNHFFAKGRFVVDKNSGVRVIVNQHGQIIEKNRGSQVTSLPIAPLPPSPQEQIANMRKYLEDISGVHDVSLGRLPGTIRSGVAIAELRQSDACVDTETEALTRRGWKKYNEIQGGEEIYVLDPKIHEGRWGKVNWIYFNDKENVDMYRFETRNFDCIATPDHSWMVKNSQGNWYRKETAELKNDNYIPLSLPSSSIPTKKTFTDDFVELAGWTITEGTYYMHKTVQDRGATDIRIYQSEANHDNVDQIKALFKRLGITRKSVCSKRNEITDQWTFIYANNEARLMRKTLPTKSLTVDFVNKLTKDQLELLLATMLKGDGHTRKKDGRQSFINTNKETIDALQVVCSLLGIATTIGKKRRLKEVHTQCYVLYLKKTDHISIGHLIDRGQMKPIKFTGRIWCPNTDAGYWLARRNGLVFYTGNTNQSDLVDNLEDFLSRSGRKILKLVAENWNTSKLISVTGLGGKPEYFMAIGERGNIGKETSKFSFGEMKLPLAIIGKDNEVRVQVGSWLAYTKEARLEKLKELFRLGAIDQKTYLEHAEFADIDGIVERTRSEALLQAKRGVPGRSTEREFGVQLDDESLALAENELMVGGSDQPVYSDDDHEVHLSIHSEEKENDLVRVHMNEHIKQMRWLRSMESTPVGAGGEGVATGEASTTFPMLPPAGPGAPPFNPGLDVIAGGGGI